MRIAMACVRVGAPTRSGQSSTVCQAKRVRPCTTRILHPAIAITDPACAARIARMELQRFDDTATPTCSKTHDWQSRVAAYESDAVTLLLQSWRVASHESRFTSEQRVHQHSSCLPLSPSPSTQPHKQGASCLEGLRLPPHCRPRIVIPRSVSSVKLFAIT